MRFLGTPPPYELTYADVFLVPAASEVNSRFAVSLSGSDVLSLQLPIVSANMNSVTGPRMAATLARRGGIGVLPQDLSPQRLAEAIQWVKVQPVKYDTPYSFTGEQSVAEVLRVLPAISGLGAVVNSGSGEYLGCILTGDLKHHLPGVRLLDIVNTGIPSLDAEELQTSEQAFKLLDQANLEFAPIMQHGHLVGVLSRKAALRSVIYQANVDSQGRLRVAAAIGVNGDPVCRATELVEAGVDLLVIDTAHGHQGAMRNVLKKVKAAGLQVPLVAGNVVTADGTCDLIAAGADIVKVGVGPGAMCTTRMMTAVGRPQFSAVHECALVGAEAGVQIWADGGVKHPRDVALAVAAGASAVMVGSWFAGTIESPGALKHSETGRLYKENWGMASTKAVSERFARLDSLELAKKELFAEGISTSRIWLDPYRPSVEDLLDHISSGLRSSFSYTGALTLAEFQEKALISFQSAAGYDEGKAMPEGW